MAWHFNDISSSEKSEKIMKLMKFCQLNPTLNISTTFELKKKIYFLLLRQKQSIQCEKFCVYYRSSNQFCITPWNENQDGKLIIHGKCRAQKTFALLVVTLFLCTKFVPFVSLPLSCLKFFYLAFRLGHDTIQGV